MKKPVKIITIGGGSSYTPEIAEGFINNYKNMPIREWWLTDIDEGDGPKKLKIIFGLVKRMFKKAGLEHVKIYITTDFVEAIKDGADFVTTQLRVGRLPAREKDELIPIKHGMLGQETNGIGGLFKALRTLPVIRDYLDLITKYAPKAWVINFTNPSGIISEYVLNDYKFKRYVGLCNLPISIRTALADNYKIPWKDLTVDAAGVNHFVYFTDFKYKGKSYMPRIMKGIENGKLLKSIGVNNIDDIDWNIDLLKALGAIPCSYHKYYYKRDFMLQLEKDEFKVNGVRSQVVTKLEKSLFEKYKDPTLAVKPKELDERGGKGYSTVAVSVINAIYNNTNEEFVVSATNKNGMVVNAPHEWVLEATCKIGKHGATKVAREIHIPKRAVGNVYLMKQFERATIDAFLAKDVSLAIAAACINPLSHDDLLTGKVFKKLFTAHKKYLTYFNK